MLLWPLLFSSKPSFNLKHFKHTEHNRKTVAYIHVFATKIKQILTFTIFSEIKIKLQTHGSPPIFLLFIFSHRGSWCKSFTCNLLHLYYVYIYQNNLHDLILHFKNSQQWHSVFLFFSFFPSISLRFIHVNIYNSSLVIFTVLHHCIGWINAKHHSLMLMWSYRRIIRLFLFST